MTTADSSRFPGLAPNVGMRVFTVDGDELGTVKEVVGDRFKVDASMQPDYWLPTRSINAITDQDVQLGFTKEELGEAKVEAPEDADRDADEGRGEIIL